MHERLRRRLLGLALCGLVLPIGACGDDKSNGAIGTPGSMASEAFCETWSELEPSFAETQQGTDPSGSLTIGDLRQIAHGRVDYLLRLPASGDELVDEALGTIIARSEDALAQLDGKVEGAFAGPSEFNLVAGSPDGDSFNVLVEYLERECGFDVRLAR